MKTAIALYLLFIIDCLKLCYLIKYSSCGFWLNFKTPCLDVKKVKLNCKKHLFITICSMLCFVNEIYDILKKYV